MDKNRILELAVAVHGFMVLGVAAVIAGFFAVSSRDQHRLPVLGALCLLVLFTLESLVAGLYAHSLRLHVLGGTYTLTLVGLFLLALKVSKK